MLKLVLVAVLTIAAASSAYAKCPPGTSYSCYQGMNGKVICGCR
jgi:hypothetical protein